MPLEAGTVLGPYEILSPLGAGGMGEVYKATDTRLERTVAIKVLPEHVASDPDLKQRFEREARTVAALNHPHICTLHDIGSQDGIDFLVMEYLDGQTLAERLEKGALPLEQALQIAIDIADALDKAHRQGIVHRDLKPGNIMLTKAGAKLLDFGLAKLKPPEQAGGLSALPTQPGNLTQQGAILGTFQYMAPEQLEGGEADQRTDIFAFGAVVYEMVTGRKAFEGKSQASLIAAILEREPPAMSELQVLSPPSLDAIIRTCLAKDPEDRWHSAGDLGRQLQIIASPRADSAKSSVPEAPSTGNRLPLLWVVPTVLALFAGAAGWAFVSPPAVAPLARLTAMPPRGVQLSFPQLSPDGQTLAFTGVAGSVSQVYVRRLDQLEAVALPGGEGAIASGFSPDGRSLLVVEASATQARPNAAAKRVPLEGGTPTTLGAAQGGADWGPDDTVVLGRPSGLWLVSASGGEPTQLTTLAEGEVAHMMPRFLPGGRAVLFYAFSAGAEAAVSAYNLDTDERTDLVPGTTPVFATSGHLMFWRAGSLWAVPFDPERLELGGDPVLVVDGVATDTAVTVAAYTVADNGTLVYRPAVTAVPNHALGWVNREGQWTTSLTEGPGLAMPALSPDGSRVVFRRFGQQGGEELWTRDLSRGSETRLTDAGLVNRFPIWTPDSTSVTFTGDLRGGLLSYSRPADLSREAELVGPPEGIRVSGSWTPDGQVLVYHGLGAAGDTDIWSLPSSGAGAPVEYLATEFNEVSPRLSPNGKWIAYISDQTGDYRVYVRAFPEAGAVFTISAGSGDEAVWSPTGRELFYRRGPQLWVVDVDTEDEFRAGTPRMLFEVPYANDFIGLGMPNYDVSLDGQQFLMVRPNGTNQATGYAVVLNWFEEL